MNGSKLSKALTNIKSYWKANSKIILIIWGFSVVVSLYICTLFVQWLSVLSGQLLTVHFFNPIYVLSYMFPGGGWVPGLFFGVLAAAGLTYYKVMMDIQEVVMDERGFEMSLNGTYGTATLMKRAERECFTDATEVTDTSNNILGELDDGRVVSITGGYSNVSIGPHKLICGVSGSWKTSSQFFPDIFQTILRGESMICTDPKGEIRNKTYKLAKKFGYVVKELNLIQPFLSDGCNFMALIENYSDARTFTDIIMTNTEGDGFHHEDFWAKGERACICFGMLYVNECGYNGEKTLPAVYEFLKSTSIAEICDLVALLPETSFAKKQWDIFLEAPEASQAGIKLGVGTRLEILNDPSIAALTANDDIDIVLPGKKPCFYYVLMSDQKSDNNVIASIFFSFLFIKIVEYADSQYVQHCDIPVNILLEEAPNVGKIPDFPKKLSTIRSRWLRCTICVQDIGQLMDMYPGNLWTNIVGNCDTRVLLGVNEPHIGAPFWSDASGEMTIRVDTERENANRLKIYNFVSAYQKSTGDGKRMVYTPDELMRMPNIYVLYYIRGHNVMKLKKFSYFNHPMFNEIEEENYFMHHPDWWDKVLHSGKGKDELQWFMDEQTRLTALRNKLAQQKDEIERKEKEKKIKEETKLQRAINSGDPEGILSEKERIKANIIIIKRSIIEWAESLQKPWTFGRFAEVNTRPEFNYDPTLDEAPEKDGYIDDEDKRELHPDDTVPAPPIEKTRPAAAAAKPAAPAKKNKLEENIKKNFKGSPEKEKDNGKKEAESNNKGFNAAKYAKKSTVRWAYDLDDDEDDEEDEKNIEEPVVQENTLPEEPVGSEIPDEIPDTADFLDDEPEYDDLSDDAIEGFDEPDIPDSAFAEENEDIQTEEDADIQEPAGETPVKPEIIKEPPRNDSNDEMPDWEKEVQKVKEKLERDAKKEKDRINKAKQSSVKGL